MMTEERLAEMKQEIKIEVLRKAKRREIIETLANYIYQVPARVKPPKVNIVAETTKEQIVERQWFRRNLKGTATITKFEYACPECGESVEDTGYGVGITQGWYLYLLCDCGWEYARLQFNR